MKQYEYTTAYLMKDDAKNINYVTAMMNNWGRQGWHFTGHAEEKRNGTFYYFARVKAVV